MAFMSTREAVLAFYRDRLRNEADLLVGWFVDGAKLSINGSGLAKQKPFEVISTRSNDNDPEARFELVQDFIGDWRWLDYDVIALTVDGDLAISRVVIDIESTATGQRERTEICEHFVFNGERFTSLIQFLDTGLREELRNAS